MKVLVQGILRHDSQATTEMDLAELLQPEVTQESPYAVQNAHARAIGNLAAMLVMKGICTIPEAQAACGVDHYKVVGRPLPDRKGH